MTVIAPVPLFSFIPGLQDDRRNLLPVNLCIFAGNADNQPPTLTCPTTTAPVLEDAPIGTVVFTCNGSDPDNATTPNGTLSYNIQGEYSLCLL